MALCVFALSLPAAESTSANGSGRWLEDYLRNDNPREQRIAYGHMLNNRAAFISPIRSELSKASEDPAQYEHIDRLIYLAAICRDASFVAPLVKIFADTSYVERSCIYACPIMLALANYELSGIWDGGKANLPDTTATGDLNAVARAASAVSLEKGRPAASGPGIGEALAKAAHLSELDLIRQAGPQTESPLDRLVAAYWLGSTVSTDKNLIDLYWLAIQEPQDASGDFRSAIYNAIYRAERARRERVSSKV